MKLTHAEEMQQAVPAIFNPALDQPAQGDLFPVPRHVFVVHMPKLTTKLLACLALVLLLCAPAWGQISVGTPASGAQDNCTTCTFGGLTLTITAGTNRNVVCQVSYRDATAWAPSMTLGGTALTQVGTDTFASFEGAASFRLLETAIAALGTGAHAISVTGDEETNRATVECKQIDGASQGAVEDVQAETGSGTISTIDDSVTTATDGAIVFQIAVLNGNRAMTPTSPQIELSDSASASHSAETNYQIDAAAGAISSEVSFTSGAFAWVNHMLVIGPAPVRRRGGARKMFRIWGQVVDTMNITTSALDSGTDEVAYSDFVEVTGGVAPYTWAVNSGSLPGGLTLNTSTGEISGTISANQSASSPFNFNIQVTDDAAESVTKDLSITVVAGGSPEPEPWEIDFGVLNDFYVDDIACGGVGTIGDPMCLSDAIAGADPGDRYFLRAGTYAGTFTLSRAGTSTNRIVWHCYVGANGDPEDAYIDGRMDIDAKWNTIECLRFGDTNGTSSDAALRMREQGAVVVNSFIKSHRNGSGMDSFNYGASMILYHNIHVDNGLCGNIPQPHNLYTHNKENTTGVKYVVGMISLDGHCTSPALDRWLFHNYNSSSGTDTRARGYHIQDVTFQDGQTVNGTQAIGDPDQHNIWRNAWVIRMDGGQYSRFGYNNLWNGEISDSLFYKSSINMKSWGAGGSFTQDTPIVFTGNRIFEPTDGRFFQGAAGGLSATNYASSTTLNSHGAAKFPDAMDWDDNQYISTGGCSTGFGLRCNGTNHGQLSFANWQTQTDACRVTPASAVGFDTVTSTCGTTLPTADEHEAFDNFYQAGWGEVRAINWDGDGSIVIPAAEVQKVVGANKAWKIWNARTGRGIGSPLETGTCSGGCGDITVSPLPGDMKDGVFIGLFTSAP